ncbi:MAG: DUF2892 domain-containing protein [Caldithrix sp.]|nr:DUF2892 domain-containing protein [Caldithrix sp.]
MKSNVGGFDRVLRIVIGVFLISLDFWGPKTNWGWIGLLPLLTGLFNFCPGYLPFKTSTKKQEN